MAEICTWDEVFTRKKEAPNLIFLTLYWYLFNKPDYQSRIAEDLGKLKEKGGFKGIPDSITDERNITTYIHEMEKYNLVGIKKRKGRRDYYQALSFLYLDPFCIETPELIGNTVKEHQEKYRDRIKELGIATYHKNSDWIWSFDALRNNAVIPAQEIAQDYSLNPEKFLKLFFRKKRYYLSLYELIRESLSNVDSLLYYFGKGRKQRIGIPENHGIEYLSIKKILDDDTPPEYFDITPVMDLTYRIMQIYTNLELGRISFSKEKLEFEGEIL